MNLNIVKLSISHSQGTSQRFTKRLVASGITLKKDEFGSVAMKKGDEAQRGGDRL